MMMRDYDGKVFQSAQKASTDIESEEEKTEKEKLTQDNKGLFEDLSKALADKVKEVRISSRLKTHPVCLVADDMEFQWKWKNIWLNFQQMKRLKRPRF